jgi:hypothetical protein
MPNAPDPELTQLSGPHRVKLRSQVRFKMAPESAELAKRYRHSGHAQVLWDHNDDYVVSWPSKREGMYVVEIVNTGAPSEIVGLTVAHRLSVNGFAFVLGTSHASAEIAAQSDLEDSPPRDS